MDFLPSLSQKWGNISLQFLRNSKVVYLNVNSYPGNGESTIPAQNQRLFLRSPYLYVKIEYIPISAYLQRSIDCVTDIFAKIPYFWMYLTTGQWTDIFALFDLFIQGIFAKIGFRASPSD